ncbi:hypothetical protein D554_2180 [Bordetella holmesii 30539]|uniref:Uncharacterized protein n=2 Tax=Bordetella holmesii TaxID=35814 RepID=A0A158LZG7_9BORD|nr:hypothetical protein D560_0523 [Bordetella holmesii ATCC 51541]EWM48238.1 hypothetical protein D556_0518 [Bordetella holmesii 41130]EWM49896.1 hypothetical protein D555_0524 [Bordetella holmesii 35009]EXF86927.1 hypothetical protein D554_2180 [Bordetella holmesii 30539]EXX95048.1 hypothetical protein D559_2475 [Bordetella holmesii 1058]KAK83433.1 hypothetical protein L496_2178 [Bordetella holmesii CDC-H572-BH]KAK83568.1 hypothetical protein L573_0374 [Bordetella holmesii H620]KAK85334.1 h
MRNRACASTDADKRRSSRRFFSGQRLERRIQRYPLIEDEAGPS